MELYRHSTRADAW